MIEMYRLPFSYLLAENSSGYCRYSFYYKISKIVPFTPRNYNL